MEEKKNGCDRQELLGKTRGKMLKVTSGKLLHITGREPLDEATSKLLDISDANKTAGCAT